jgi:DNA-binding NarL/FixJ family response regulator
VSGNLTEMTLDRLRHSHVHGCLLKSTAHGPELKLALTELAAGRTYYSKDLVSAITETRRQPDYYLKILSPREIELLPYFGYGWSNERVAVRTGLSPATVRTHHQNILSKLGLHGREELMRWAMKKGFVDFRYEPTDTTPGAVEENPVDWIV